MAERREGEAGCRRVKNEKGGTGRAGHTRLTGEGAGGFLEKLAGGRGMG